MYFNTLWISYKPDTLQIGAIIALLYGYSTIEYNNTTSALIYSKMPYNSCIKERNIGLVK